MEKVFFGVGFGLVTGAILALSAVAFTLQYAVSNVPNLAHGELLTYGAYAAYVTTRWTHNLVAAGLAAALTGGLVAWAMNAGMIEPFVRARIKNIVIFIDSPMVMPPSSCERPVFEMLYGLRKPILSDLSQSHPFPELPRRSVWSAAHPGWGNAQDHGGERLPVVANRSCPNGQGRSTA